jgi:proteic killer suppression protein
MRPRGVAYVTFRPSTESSGLNHLVLSRGPTPVAVVALPLSGKYNHDGSMIRDFADKTTEDIFNGVSSKDARKIPKELWDDIRRKLDLINAAQSTNDLAALPGNRFKKLKGTMAGRFSMRVNDQYRIVFDMVGADASKVQATDYHRGEP